MSQLSNDLRTHRRPDGRTVVWPSGAWTLDQAVSAVRLARTLAAPVITHVGADRTAEHEILADAGFTLARRELTVEVDLDAALAALADATLPAGIVAVSAADADPDRLRLLDDALRDDVPGTRGWRSTPEQFAEDSFNDPDFDPATYLVAVDEQSGEYVGLVRVWVGSREPRIGMFGVRREYRRRGIALALLARCLWAARRAGSRTATSSYDETNQASAAIFDRLGARRVGMTLEFELVYR